MGKWSNLGYIVNVEPTGLADALHVRCEKKVEVKDYFKVFTSVVGRCCLTEMAKISERTGFGYGGEGSRVCC